jgi:hypothetical protein
MLIIVEDMQNYTHAWPFLEPVNIDDVADYYDIIKDPMGKSHCYKRKKKQASKLTLFMERSCNT